MALSSPEIANATTIERPKEIHSLYILKAFCALIVVLIHMPPFISLLDMSIFSPFGFIVVPLFYMVTGYFLYSPSPQQVASRAIKSSRKVLLTTILLNVAYLIPLLLNDKMPIQSVEDVLLLIFQGSTIQGVLWYMTALFWALLFIYALCRWGLSRLLLWFLWLIPIGILCTRYAFVLGHSGAIYLELTVYGLSLPYILLGYAIKKYEEKLLVFPWEILSWLFFFLSVLEVFVLDAIQPGTWGRYIFTPIWCTSLFMWCLQNPTFGENSYMAKVGKVYAGNIYYWHILVAFVIRGCLGVLGRDLFYPQIGGFYVFIATLIVSVISISIQDKFKLSWIR